MPEYENGFDWVVSLSPNIPSKISHLLCRWETKQIVLVSFKFEIMLSFALCILILNKSYEYLLLHKLLMENKVGIQNLVILSDMQEWTTRLLYHDKNYHMYNLCQVNYRMTGRNIIFKNRIYHIFDFSKNCIYHIFVFSCNTNFNLFLAVIQILVLFFGAFGGVNIHVKC